MAESQAKRAMSGDVEKPRRKRGLVWLIFFAPGALMMWWQYMFPKAGEVFGSGRRLNNRFLQFATTMGIYAMLFFMWLLLTDRLDFRHPATPAGGPPAVTQPAPKL